MSDPEVLVTLALRILNCSQKELGLMLGVSAPQISKWKNQNDHMSMANEDKIRELCQIGEVPEILVLDSGSLENAEKWDKLFRYLADHCLEIEDCSWDCAPLMDFFAISEQLCETFRDLGVEFPKKIPTLLGDDDSDFEDFFKNPHVQMITNIFSAHIAIFDFFSAYFQNFTDDDETSDVAHELESNLFSLAVCKADLDPKIAPNYKKYKYTELKWFKNEIVKIKSCAVKSNLPLREELNKLVTDTLGELTTAAEREAFGFNMDQQHPDIYINELLEGMREIRQELREIKEKLQRESVLNEGKIKRFYNRRPTRANCIKTSIQQIR